jgi:hypothetical protein
MLGIAHGVGSYKEKSPHPCEVWALSGVAAGSVYDTVACCSYWANTAGVVAEAVPVASVVGDKPTISKSGV